MTSDPEAIVSLMKRTPLLRRILPIMRNYYETQNYIFVHGWIPCEVIGGEYGQKQYFPLADWRNASEAQWARSRWTNGMEAAHRCITEPGKTIVCGHWHCSFGHARYEGIGEELGERADFSPYCADGIVAIDACTVHSRKINCIVLRDEPLSDLSRRMMYF